MDVSDVMAALALFKQERDWDQFHSPENLAKSISIESAELLECFQWGNSPHQDVVKNELADVLTYCFFLADKLDVDPLKIVLEKLEVSRAKYPADRVRGKSLKYDQYPDRNT